MSALASVRRRRAEQMIARDYETLRDRVLRSVAGQLRRRSVFFDAGDLEAHYNIAWQGLYSRVIAGETIENPSGFLVTIVYRRALDESRRVDTEGRAVTYEVTDETIAEVTDGRDAAGQIDDYTTIRHFREALKDRLDRRECEAATLCYIHGYSRPDAAKMLGVPPRRMEKIMDAVSQKVAAVVKAIEAGQWCQERRSLMNAYALGVLDRAGERYELAREHLGDCAACRHYVRGVQGLAAITPPIALPFAPFSDSASAASLLDGLREAIAPGSDVIPRAAGAAATAKAAAVAKAAGSGGSVAGGGAAVGATGGALGAKAAALVATIAVAAGAAVATGIVEIPAKADHTPSPDPALAAPAATRTTVRGTTEPSGARVAAQRTNAGRAARARHEKRRDERPKARLRDSSAPSSTASGATITAPDPTPTYTQRVTPPSGRLSSPPASAPPAGGEFTPEG